MNPNLRELAKYMADYFSRDAVYWRGQAVLTTADHPICVTFRWFGSFVPAVGTQLLGHLSTVMREPYRSENEPSAMLHQASSEEADAVIVLAEASQDQAAGVAYEIHFAGSSEVWPGWFALPPV